MRWKPKGKLYYDGAVKEEMLERTPGLRVKDMNVEASNTNAKCIGTVVSSLSHREAERIILHCYLRLKPAIRFELTIISVFRVRKADFCKQL